MIAQKNIKRAAPLPAGASPIHPLRDSRSETRARLRVPFARIPPQLRSPPRPCQATRPCSRRRRTRVPQGLARPRERLRPSASSRTSPAHPAVRIPKTSGCARTNPSRPAPLREARSPACFGAIRSRTVPAGPAGTLQPSRCLIKSPELSSPPALPHLPPLALATTPPPRLPSGRFHSSLRWLWAVLASDPLRHPDRSDRQGPRPDCRAGRRLWCTASEASWVVRSARLQSPPWRSRSEGRRRN